MAEGNVPKYLTQDEAIANVKPDGDFRPNQDTYITPCIMAVFCGNNFVVPMGWYTLIVSGKYGTHLEQILINSDRIARRYHEGGSWSTWSTKAFS